MPFSNLSVLLILPFVLLLGMIATGPVLYPRLWHRYYAFISIAFAGLIIGYYSIVLRNIGPPIEALIDYIQFIALIGSLYITAGGILIDVKAKSAPLNNVLLLWVGAVLANIIGTTGASMLLIRPFIRINKADIKPYHIVFFIFMVSNVGGVLTPVGDPPLFLGFLKGVPFFWTLRYCFLPWLVALSLLSILFYLIDRYHQPQATFLTKKPTLTKTTIKIEGKKNFVFLLLIGVAVFIDPSIFDWVPSITFHNHKYSFIRELIFFAIAIFAYVAADKEVLKRNAFSFEPLKEVICIFLGIFCTMIPALALINAFAQSSIGQKFINPHTLFWGVGSLSAFLDNAPTYLTSLQAGVIAQNCDSVLDYAQHASNYLRATSVSAVFFGAMTYIGNGPNYMVQKIAQENGIKMPSFFSYFLNYAIPYLLPVLMAIWFIFFLYS